MLTHMSTFYYMRFYTLALFFVIFLIYFSRTAEAFSFFILILLISFMIFSKSWNKVIGPEACTTLHNWRDYDKGLLYPMVFLPSACLQMGAPKEMTGISPHLLVFLWVKWIRLLAEEFFLSLTSYCKFLRLRKHPVGIAMRLRLCCGFYDCSVVEEHENN